VRARVKAQAIYQHAAYYLSETFWYLSLHLCSRAVVKLLPWHHRRFEDPSGWKSRMSGGYGVPGLREGRNTMRR